MGPAVSGLRVGDEELQVSRTTVNAERSSLLGYYAISTGKYRRSEGF
jgi:hypothetical protein